MYLKEIVQALGGDLYAGGLRANIPAPGHSAADRSVSLLWSRGRIIIHSFGQADWRDIRDHLRALGPGGTAPSMAADAPPKPSVDRRIATAERLWSATRPVAGTLGERHLRLRRIRRLSAELRFGANVPVSVYSSKRFSQPALVAAIRAPDGALRAVEITYLDPQGRQASRLRLPRKTVGVMAAGAALRLDEPAAKLLVGEGAATTLSASERFALPAWALLSANNLARWSPPAAVREVLIAADRGRAGEVAAATLHARLQAAGVVSVIELPPAPFEDWNAAAPERKGEGG